MKQPRLPTTSVWRSLSYCDGEAILQITSKRDTCTQPGIASAFTHDLASDYFLYAILVLARLLVTRSPPDPDANVGMSLQAGRQPVPQEV